MALRERVTAIDELNMAVCRMRLREAEEPVIDPPPSNIVEPSQVSCHVAHFLVIIRDHCISNGCVA